MASLLGIVVGNIPVLSNALIPVNGIFHPVFEAMRTLSNGYLPSVLLVLAGSLINTDVSIPKNSDEVSPVETSSKDKSKFLTQVAIAYLCRFLIMPVIGFSLLEFFKVFFPGFYLYLKSNPLLLFILLLETCMPSAQNTVTIMQLSGDKLGSRNIAALLLILYTLGTPAITFWLAKILQFTKVPI